MYEKYYGLKAKPFCLSPDPRFFFTSATHKSALAYLRYGLYQGEGFIIVTGGAGIGKTTLVRTLLGELSHRDMVVGELVTTQLQAEDLLRAIATAFHLDCRGAKSDLITRLHAYFMVCARKSQRVLLVVDEAHNLPLSSFEELRMLSNFQEGARAMMQCILLGQTPLRELLAQSTLEQLQQRVIAAHHIHPLTPEETRGYILHRLRHAGWKGDPSFSGEALGLVHCCSGGIPRRINALCDRLLLFTYLEERHALDEAAVMQVHAEWAEEIGMDQGGIEDWDAVTPPLSSLGLEQAQVAEPASMSNQGMAVSHAAKVADAPAMRPTTARRSASAGAHIRVAPRAHATPSATTVDPACIKPSRTAAVTGPPPSSPYIRPLAGVGVVLAFSAALVWMWPQMGGEQQLAQRSSSELAEASESPQAGPVLAELQQTETSLPTEFEQDAPEAVPLEDDVALSEPATPSAAGLNDTAQETTAASSAPAPLVTQQTRSVSAAPEVDKPVKPAGAESALKPVASMTSPTQSKMAVTTARDERSEVPTVQKASAPPDVAEKTITPVLPRADETKFAVAAERSINISTAAAPIRSPPEADTDTVAESLIAPDELNKVLSRFQVAYEAGDMGTLLRLFSNDAPNRADIAEAYEKLFNITDARHLALNAMQWQTRGEAMHGEGQFGVTVREKGRTRESSYTGRISLRLEKRHGKVLITELKHAYTD